MTEPFASKLSNISWLYPGAVDFEVQLDEEQVRDLVDAVAEYRQKACAAITAAQDETRQREAERDEARQLARDLWSALSTDTKVQIFERSDGWVPAWVRPLRS